MDINQNSGAGEEKLIEDKTAQVKLQATPEFCPITSSGPAPGAEPGAAPAELQPGRRTPPPPGDGQRPRSARGSPAGRGRGREGTGPSGGHGPSPTNLLCPQPAPRSPPSPARLPPARSLGPAGRGSGPGESCRESFCRGDGAGGAGRPPPPGRGGGARPGAGGRGLAPPSPPPSRPPLPWGGGAGTRPGPHLPLLGVAGGRRRGGGKEAGAPPLLPEPRRPGEGSGEEGKGGGTRRREPSAPVRAGSWSLAAGGGGGGGDSPPLWLGSPVGTAAPPPHRVSLHALRAGIAAPPDRGSPFAPEPEAAGRSRAAPAEPGWRRRSLLRAAAHRDNMVEACGAARGRRARSRGLPCPAARPSAAAYSRPWVAG